MEEKKLGRKVHGDGQYISGPKWESKLRRYGLEFVEQNDFVTSIDSQETSLKIYSKTSSFEVVFVT